MKVDSVYREGVTSKAHRIPDVHSWEQSIIRYSGSIEDITFVDMDRMVTTFVTLIFC